MVGRVARKYKVSTTTMSTEKPTLTMTVPKPRMPPSTLVILEVSETKRLTSVVMTVATSNSSSMARDATELMISDTTVGNICTNSDVRSTNTGTSAATNTAKL